MIDSVRRIWRPAATFLLVGTGLAVVVPQPQPARAVAPTIDDVNALLADRSPGERAPGALYQTKPDFFHRYGGGPRERVLDQFRSHPPGGDAAPGGAPGLTDAGPEGGAVAAPGDPGGVAGPVGPGFSFADGGGGLPALGGLVTNPGPNATPTPSPTPTSTPVVPAVPEPATWLSMILGLAIVGLMLRRRSPVPDGAR